MKFIRFFAIFFIVIDGCVDPFPLPDTGTDSKLVVYGNINQLPGPYEVQLFHSSSLENNRNVVYETGASVWIYDDAGNSERLQEVKFGIYQTRNFQGVVGRSYHITIETYGGRKYKSGSQKILEAVPVKNLYKEFTTGVTIVSDEGATRDGFSLYLDAEGTPDNNLFRWRWTGIHTVRSFPELHDTLYPRAREPRPYPLPCSGYIYNGGQLRKVGECTCCTCYSYFYNPNALVSNNAFVSNYQFNKVSLGVIPVTAMTFYEKYYVEVEQFTLNDESYDFWKLIQSQQEATGSIFQPNAVRIKGNIESENDPNEIALGIFEAVAVSRKGIFIGKEEIPYDLPPIGQIGEDCRRAFANSTTIRPVFW